MKASGQQEYSAVVNLSLPLAMKLLQCVILNQRSLVSRKQTRPILYNPFEGNYFTLNDFIGNN